MNLILASQQVEPTDEDQAARGADESRNPDSLAQVLDWLDAEAGIDRVIAIEPLPALNPFALARALRARGAPPLLLVGDMPAYRRFWAERNGAQVADNLPAALAMENRLP